jgi:predicted phage terminase large subunit-like protein
MAVNEKVTLRAHQGPQSAFLSSPADIAIMGGAAGGGKTIALLMEPIRHLHRRGFRAAIFRRLFPQIMQPGGMWDEASEMYPLHPLNGKGYVGPPAFYRFPSGAEIQFGHLQHDEDRERWKGAQIGLLGFDQLEDFTEAQFWYLLSRNRSVSGIKPYVRATCNPDATSWLARFIAWWIDQDTGYAIDERSGVLRWMIRYGDELNWFDSEQEAKDAFPDLMPRSVTFIPALLEDNPTLMRKDPGYRANLLALPLVERERLLRGNWKIMPRAGMYFRRDFFDLVDRAPDDCTWVRAWDLAASVQKTKKDDPDYTVSVKLGRSRGNGRYYVGHVFRLRGSPDSVKSAMLAHARSDGPETVIRIPQDPGQAGKAQLADLTKMLAGYVVRSKPISGDKIARAGPVSSQCEAGNVSLVRSTWNEAFLVTLENFPEGSHDDDVDAFADAFDAHARVPEPKAVIW